MKQLAEFRIHGLLLGAHEEVTKNGFRMVKATIEVTRTVKGQEKNSKLQITCLGQSGDSLLGTKYLLPVVATGVIEGREWQKKDGGLGMTIELIAFDVIPVQDASQYPAQPSPSVEQDIPF